MVLHSNKFQVGDIVRIRDWDDMCNEYQLDGDYIDIDDIGFISEMRQYCGEVVRIKSLSPYSDKFDSMTVRFENHDSSAGGWTYTTSMIELIKRPGSETIHESEPDLFAILTA